MANYLAYVGSETFAPGSQITFGSLYFLTQETGELRLVSHNEANATGPGPKRSTRTKAKKQRLKRRITTLRQRLNASIVAAKRWVKAVPPSTMVAVVGHQLTSILNLLEDTQVVPRWSPFWTSMRCKKETASWPCHHEATMKGRTWDPPSKRRNTNTNVRCASSPAKTPFDSSRRSSTHSSRRLTNFTITLSRDALKLKSPRQGRHATKSLKAAMACSTSSTLGKTWLRQP
jgi:hypothetical protein